MKSVRRVQQQSGGWAITGENARIIERMDAIPNSGTMAGSQGADSVLAAPCNLAHGFCNSGVHAFVKP
jgi:hypothetical protein